MKSVHFNLYNSRSAGQTAAAQLWYTDCIIRSTFAVLDNSSLILVEILRTNVLSESMEICI